MTAVFILGEVVKLSVGVKNTPDFKPHPPPNDKGSGASIVNKYGYSWFLHVMCFTE